MMEVSTMNFLAVTLIVFISNSYAAYDFRHRCLLFMNACVLHCPQMMHPYNTRCDLETVSQRTCLNPDVEILGFTCGWSRCDCNGDLVLDEQSGLCVPISECTTEIPLRFRHTPESDHEAKVSHAVRIPHHGLEDERLK